MKSSDRYARQVSDILISIYRAETLTIELDERINNFLRVLRKSRWQGKFTARNSIFTARDDLQNKHKPKLRLIQGGNDFLARRSKAVLTLIVSNDSKQLNKVG